MRDYSRKFVPLALAVAGLALMALSTACATDTRGWVETNEELVAANPAFYALSQERRVSAWIPMPDSEYMGCPGVDAAIQLTSTDIWIGTTIGERWRIANTSEGRDWQALAEALETFRGYPTFEYARYIQLAADDSVAYGDILKAVDLAVGSDFKEISYREPADLAVQFASL